MATKIATKRVEGDTSMVILRHHQAGVFGFNVIFRAPLGTLKFFLLNCSVFFAVYAILRGSMEEVT